MTTVRPRKNGTKPEQQQRDDQAPRGHGHRVLRNDAHRCQHGVGNAGVPVEHHRKRHDADAQCDQCEQEADAAAGNDQRPSLRCRQHFAREVGNIRRRFITECRDINRLCDGDPHDEQRQQQHAEPEHRAERGRAQYRRSLPCGGLLAAFAAAAEFVKTERGEGADQRKAGGQRKQQWQHRIAEHRACQHEAEDRIDRAQDDGVTRHGLEIFPPKSKRVVQIGNADAINRRARRCWGIGVNERCDIAGI